jgi:hypothetical protein
MGEALGEAPSERACRLPVDDGIDVLPALKDGDSNYYAEVES